MNALYFTTGQAARELGITQAQVRALCQANAIVAELTDGGQWRLPKAEVDRLKRDGLPPVPRPLPGDNPRPSPAKARYGHPALLAEPSEEVVAGAEGVAITENLLKKRKLEQQLEETEDWFREREQEEAEQQAADEEEARLRLAEVEAQWERDEWLRRWETFALDAVPYDAPPELRLKVLPWGFAEEQKGEALAAVAKAINELAEGTPQSKLEQARDEALAPYLAAHAQRERKVKLVEDGLRGVFAYLLKLERDWDFEGKGAYALELEMKGAIRKQLEKELTGEEKPEQLEKRLHRLVREKLGIERRLVHARRAS